MFKTVLKTVLSTVKILNVQLTVFFPIRHCRNNTIKIMPGNNETNFRASSCNAGPHYTEMFSKGIEKKIQNYPIGVLGSNLQVELYSIIHSFIFLEFMVHSLYFAKTVARLQRYTYQNGRIGVRIDSIRICQSLHSSNNGPSIGSSFKTVLFDGSFTLPFLFHARLHKTSIYTCFFYHTCIPVVLKRVLTESHESPSSLPIISTRIKLQAYY